MYKKTFLQKSIVCLLTGIIGAYAMKEVTRKILPQWEPAVNDVSVLFIISAAIFIIIWHYREKRQKINTEKVLAFWQGTMRYFIAIDLAMFAWRKIFLLQFYAPHGLLDKQVSAMTGEQFTIAYFGYSYPFGVCLAGLQLTGAILLLFRRTILLGIFILIPVMTNIVLLDIFYDIETGALIMAFMLLLGLFYLLLCDYEKVKEFFFSTKQNFPSFNSGNPLLKNILRSSAILIPLVICILLYDFPNRHPEITGKYEVRKLAVNHKDVDLTNCKDTVLTTIYIDNNNDIVFERNSRKNWQVGHFNYDKKNRQLNVIWRYPENFHDTLSATLGQHDQAMKMTFTGTMGGDTLEADLLKVK